MTSGPSSQSPTWSPSLTPTEEPSVAPTWRLSQAPSASPSSSATPSVDPSLPPSATPSVVPSIAVTSGPSSQSPSFSPFSVMNPVISQKRLNSSISCYVDDDMPVGNFVQSRFFLKEGRCAVNSYSFNASSLFYKLSNSTEFFEIENFSGVLRLNKSLSSVQEKSLRFQVSIFDSGICIGSINVTVTIVSLTTAPSFNFPGFLPNYCNISLAENVSYDGVVFNSLSSFVVVPKFCDNDSSIYCKQEYQIIAGSSGVFIMTNTSIGQLSFARKFLNYQLRNFYDIVVRVVGGNGLYSDAIIHINVLKMSSQPLIILSDPNADGSVFAGSKAGTVVSDISIVAFLGDLARTNISLTLEIEGGNTHNAFQVLRNPIQGTVVDGKVEYYLLTVFNSSAVTLGGSVFSLNIKAYSLNEPAISSTLTIGVHVLIPEFLNTTILPPRILNITQDDAVDTSGGSSLSIHGMNLNTQQFLVSLYDPRSITIVDGGISKLGILPMTIPGGTSIYQYSIPVISNNMRIYESPCPTVFKSSNIIKCLIPPGLGTNLTLVLRQVDFSTGTFLGSTDWLTLYNKSSFVNSFSNSLSYDPPYISRIDTGTVNNYGDANGGNTLRIQGGNFGAIRSPSIVMIVDFPYNTTECLSSLWLADDPTTNYSPYVRCLTQRSRVGRKNVTLSIAYQQSHTYSSYQVHCKANFYGIEGEKFLC